MIKWVEGPEITRRGQPLRNDKRIVGVDCPKTIKPKKIWNTYFLCELMLFSIQTLMDVSLILNKGMAFVTKFSPFHL